MELRHIRYFLAVAEEGNFTRAAARLGIGQPPLSQQIRDLEEEIGARLFHRVPHGAELTEAGRAFLANVRSMPELVRAAVTSAQRAARGETGSLRVGYTATSMLTPVVPGSIRAFRRAFPDVELVLVEGNSTDLAQAVRDGGLDLAFLRPGALDPGELAIHALPDEPMVAVLPIGHTVAANGEEEAVRLADLRNDAFVLTPRDIGPSLHDEILSACREAGFEPILGQPAPQILSVLSLVAAEQGVSVVPASMRQLAFNGVAYREIADARPLARLALVHRRGSTAVLVRNFVVQAREATTAGCGFPELGRAEAVRHINQ